MQHTMPDTIPDTMPNNMSNTIPDNMPHTLADTMVENRCLHPLPAVHVIDDDAEVLASCGFLLSSIGIDAVMWHSAVDFLQATDVMQPAVVISDIMMATMDGKQLQQHLKQSHSPIAFIALTGRGEISDAVSMLKLGAVDYIEKPMQLNRLTPALDNAYKITEQNFYANQCADLYQTLTDKEKQIAICLLHGKLNKVIAEELHIAIRTVEVHRAHVMEKMQANHLSELLKKLLLIDCL